MRVILIVLHSASDATTDDVAETLMAADIGPTHVTEVSLPNDPDPEVLGAVKALSELMECIVVSGHDPDGTPLYKVEGFIHAAVQEAHVVLGEDMPEHPDA